MTHFEGIVPALGKALTKREYSELTPVQLAVIDPKLDGNDLLVSAQTGSGKTVAFGLAMASDLLNGDERFEKAHLEKNRAPLALVVAPTRELALQVKRELEWLYAETGAIIASCVGGMDMRSERRTLERGAHIVVGTPGRLCDHVRRRSFSPAHLKAVVLDEADEMLDLGFKEELEFILESTPEERRTLMFSATVPQMIAKLAKQYQRDAIRVTTSQEQKQHVDIEYRALNVAPREHENAIINVLRYYEAKNALVFCNTRATVNHMMARLNNRGFSVVALSGELSQNERTHALQAMRDGRARVCIATDVAARGIDLPNLELVIHADLPSNPETLLHRSGRTGRAGRKGVSALIIDNRNRKKAERLLRFAKINANWATAPSADEVNQRDEERILANPILSDPVQPEEQAFVQQLMEGFSAEQLAAAFMRLNREGRSAPEELQDVAAHAPEPYSRDGRSKRSERPDGRKDRNDFDNSIWFTLSVGRKQKAEPRWLIPMLCKAGGLTKRDIGVIKMQDNDTLVQLDAEQADGFFEALGPDRKLEKNVIVTRLEGTPKSGTEPYVKPRGSRPDKPKSGGKRKFDDRKQGSDKPDFEKSCPGKRERLKSKENEGETVNQSSESKRGKPVEYKEGWAKKKSKSKPKSGGKSGGKSKPNSRAKRKKAAKP